MNPSPRTQPVTELGPEVREKVATIRPVLSEETIRPILFELTVDDGVKVATCKSSVSLANWAWANGALRVVHDFDLRLSC